MKFVESKHGPGTVGYFTAWHPRYFDFYDALSPLMVPPGSVTIRSQSSSSVSGMNRLAQKFEGEWLWALPDDHTWQPDLLMKLLDRNVDLVAPVVCMRAPPFESVAFKKIDYTVLEGGCPRWTWDEIAQARGEMLPCHAIGLGGLLIRRRVFEKLEQPYFSALLPDGLTEDIEFTNRCYEAGFQVMLDTSVGMTHIIEGKLLPLMHCKDGKWEMTVEIMGRTFSLDL